MGMAVRLTLLILAAGTVLAGPAVAEAVLPKDSAAADPVRNSIVPDE